MGARVPNVMSSCPVVTAGVRDGTTWHCGRRASWVLYKTDCRRPSSLTSRPSVLACHPHQPSSHPFPTRGGDLPRLSVNAPSLATINLPPTLTTLGGHAAFNGCSSRSPSTSLHPSRPSVLLPSPILLFPCHDHLLLGVGDGVTSWWPTAPSAAAQT